MANLELLDVGKLEVIETFWDKPQDKYQEDAIHLDSYFEYFHEQIRLARQNNDCGQICSRIKICGIVQRLKAKQHRDMIRKELAVENDYDQEEYGSTIDDAINVASRLWLMVHIGNVGRGVTGQTVIAWRQGCLQEVIVKHFQHQLVLTDTVKFEKVFNLLNVERIAGVVIQWTPNLVDHLRLREDGKLPVLNIFHHAAFLEYHKAQYVDQDFQLARRIFIPYLRDLISSQLIFSRRPRRRDIENTRSTSSNSRSRNKTLVSKILYQTRFGPKSKRMRTAQAGRPPNRSLQILARSPSNLETVLRRFETTNNQAMVV